MASPKPDLKPARRTRLPREGSRTCHDYGDYGATRAFTVGICKNVLLQYWLEIVVWLIVKAHCDERKRDCGENCGVFKRISWLKWSLHEPSGWYMLQDSCQSPMQASDGRITTKGNDNWVACRVYSIPSYAEGLACTSVFIYIRALQDVLPPDLP